jgi:hypothetical protein
MSALYGASRGAWEEPTRPGSLRTVGREPDHSGPPEGPGRFRLSVRRGLELAAHRDIDRSIVELWRKGIRGQGEIGRLVGRDQRSVSRRIARLVRIGAWPFGDRPARGRVQVPVASGFTAMPIIRAFPGEAPSLFHS